MDRGLNQTEAANLMGINNHRLCDIESGRRFSKRVSTDIVQRVSLAFNVPTSEVLKSIQTVMHISQSTEEVLFELMPLLKSVELTANRLVLMSSSMPQEYEDTAKCLHEDVKKAQILTKLVMNRNFPTLTKKKILGGR